MVADGDGGRRRFPAIRFRQWLAEWDAYDFDSSAHRRRPSPYLYMFSMPAGQLRNLSDVYKRTRKGVEAEGIQRLRDESRTGRIQQYVRFGYPYGDLKVPQRTAETLPFRKPGWLPTAIVINILTAPDKRRGRSVQPEHLAEITDLGENRFEIEVPELSSTADIELAPFEVIDGQHRLWAFDDSRPAEIAPDEFELPVVAFQGLDIAWQAYLFWSINVSPKRINPSHAFDLYPLLRSQDWLDRVGLLTVYREARAQELTELLYTNPRSPWNNRINMLGERGRGGVSQATWVRALLASFLSTGIGRGRAGLFQSDLNNYGEPLEWSRSQQAALLIQLWIDIAEELEKHKSLWWIRAYKDPGRALTDRTSMLNQDQGVRAVHAIANDIFFERALNWQLERWIIRAPDERETTPNDVDDALDDLQRTPFRDRIRELAAGFASFDWRSIDGPEVANEAEVQMVRRAYRGSGGYSALTADVLTEIAKQDSEVAGVANSLLPGRAK